MQQLIDSLNNALLPFVGRQAELERILAFWRGTFDAQELRAALLVGEAGVGKSRLVDEAVSGIAAAGGTAIQIRLFPESATSIVPLFAQSLLYAESVRRLLRAEPEETLVSVVGALRRIARLRPTIVIVEDIHLLAGDAVRDLASLLEALAEESISLLATTRPVELAAGAPLERFLVERIELDGLDDEAVGELWRRVFDAAGDGEVVAELATATAGNPLAIRSALRSAVRTGWIAYDAPTSAWKRSVDLTELGRLLRRNVELVAEGMATHLSDEERGAASALATLGEAFAMEAAERLLPGVAGILPSLIFKGTIVRPATAPAPIPGTPPSGTPLAFTHTLLHQHLASTAEPPVEALLEVIASGLPLYSIAPFRIIAVSELPGRMAPELLERAIERVVLVSYRLDAGPDWKLARDVMSAGWRLLKAFRQQAPERRALPLHLMLLGRNLSWLRRQKLSEEFASQLDEMLRLTAEPLDPTLAPYRLKALHHLHELLAETDYPRTAEVWQQVEQLRAAHPELSRDEFYLIYLEEVARTALRVPDGDMLRLVEARLEEMLADPELPESIGRAARLRVAPALLHMFDSAEELERRMELLRQLPSEPDGENMSIVMHRIVLLETTGCMEEANAAAQAAVGRLRAIGLQRNAATCALISLCARAALGLELEDLERETARLLAANDHTASPAFRRNVGIYLSEIGWLRGELGWTRRMVAELQPGEPPYWPAGDILDGLDRGELAASLDRMDMSDETQRRLDIVGRRIAGARGAGAAEAGAAEAGAAEAGTAETEAPDAAEQAALALLARPLLRLEDLLILHATLSMIAAGGRRGIPAPVRQAARRALTDALVWTSEQNLAPLMRPLVERYPGHLSRREREVWQERLRELEAARSRREESRRATKMMLRVFGTISLGAVGEEPIPLRGARLQTLLALLVATRLVRRPLTHREFCRIAAGGESDPDLARKTANMAVIRLREAIGAEMVLTGDDTYHLNLERIDVDLLEAYRLLDETRAALRRGALARGVQAVVRTLDIVHGEVLFPGLYDDFFEALRNDFEFRLRSAILDVARALMRESDPGNAVDLLRHALEGLPDDEEIGELLRQALTACGLHVEAERVRIQLETATDL